MSAGRTVHPSHEERRKWTLFVEAARQHGEALLDHRNGHEPSAKKLLAARRRCRRAVMPENQQSIASPLMDLVRLVDTWAALPILARVMRAAEMIDRARRTAEEITPSKPRHRADIED